MNQAEVGDLRPSVGADQDVRGFYVAVHEARVVGRRQGASRRFDLGSEGFERARGLASPRAQGAPWGQLHRDERPVAHGADLVDRQQVGVFEGRHRSGFLAQADHRVGVGVELEQLEREWALEVGVEGTVDLAEGTFPQQRFDAEATQGLRRAIVPGQRLDQRREAMAVGEVQLRGGGAGGHRRRIADVHGCRVVSARHRRSGTIAEMVHQGVRILRSRRASYARTVTASV